MTIFAYVNKTLKRNIYDYSFMRLSGLGIIKLHNSPYCDFFEHFHRLFKLLFSRKKRFLATKSTFFFHYFLLLNQTKKNGKAAGGGEYRTD